MDLNNMSQLIKYTKDILREENILFRYVNSLRDTNTYHIILDNGTLQDIYISNDNGTLKMTFTKCRLNEMGHLKVEHRMYNVDETIEVAMETYIRNFARGHIASHQNYIVSEFVCKSVGKSVV